MKTLLKKMPFFFLPFLILGCAENPNQGGQNTNNSDQPTEDSKNDPPKKDDDSKEPEPWFYDDTTHYHKTIIDGVECISNSAVHTGKECNLFNGAKHKLYQCDVCKAYYIDGLASDFPMYEKIPDLKFTTTDSISFANNAKMEDLSRPEVMGSFSLSNCDSQYAFDNVTGGMKVRGNQTAKWDKKGFRIKFDEKRNVLGLNEGKKFKKWVLFADAKDTALIRSALGLYLSDAVCKDDGIFISDFTPVNVYLNDTYWGYYYLAEQKEVKGGRINLPEPAEGYEGTDIGYCFELDYYATNEDKKPDGDPTFSIEYKPKEIGYTLKQSEGIANFWSHIGVVKTYTMLSDITDKTTQIPFIKTKVQDCYRILYETAVNKKAMMINSSGQIVNSTETDLKKNLENYFDLNTWADGYLVNEISCTPDVGYSSFYMSFNNTENGDKKLRYENPWDFDSNFGNRNGFITNGDDLYLKRCANQWLNLLSKIDFFMDIVKEKWNSLMNSGKFEMAYNMMYTYFNSFDSTYVKNFQRWPTLHNEIVQEVRDPFKNTGDYKKAQAETINWLTKRINYLNQQWGAKK